MPGPGQPPYNRVGNEAEAFSMSLASNGKSIRCDGPGCTRTTSAPVSLRPSDTASAAVGWLFVATGGTVRHYCPACAAGVLARSSQASGQEPGRG